MPTTAQEGPTIPPTEAPPTTSSKPPVPGQVCYVYESIATPIELIFLRTPAIQADPSLVRQCQEALDQIHAPGSRIGKVRPCIVMRAAIEGIRAETICLNGTFGGADPGSLGKVYKDFARGIFPNRGSSGSRHLHLVPEGQEEHSWVIASEFETFRPIADTWLKAAQAGGYRGPLPRCMRGARRRGAVPRHLETTSQAILRDECETCFDSWQAECQDQPEVAVECLKEHRNQRHPNSRTTLNGSMCSLSLYAPSTVTVSVDSLQEEGIAEVKDDVIQDFRPQDSCTMCEIQAKKAPKTGRKASRFSLRRERS